MKTYTKLGLGLLAAAAMAAGCVTTRQERKTEASTFLGETAGLLKPGETGQALLVYINPKVNWKKYKNVQVSPVTYWLGEGEEDGLADQQRKALVDYLFSQLREKFGAPYPVVDSAGPDTLQFSAAIINAKASKPALSTIATLFPPTLAYDTLKTAITGRPSWVGNTRGEFKVTDAKTGEVLAAASDKRVGGLGWKGKFNELGSVESSSRYWAEKAVYRLCVLQEKPDCQMPKEY